MARFGMWSTAPGCDFYSWRSTFKYLCGISLNFCSRSEYYEVTGTERVKSMPCYPEKGSILKTGEFTVVKISNTY